jgi:hypothetical protein
MIEPEDLDIWLNVLKKDWDIKSKIQSFNDFIDFAKNLPQKYAARNIINCSKIEQNADIFIIKNNTCEVNYQNLLENINSVNLDSVYEPQYICHNPLAKIDTYNNITQLEIRDSKFRIWFSTNELTRGFIAFVKINNEDKDAPIISNCQFKFNSNQNDQIVSWWSSQFFDLPKNKTVTYQIYLKKHNLRLNLENKKSKLKLDIFINNVKEIPRKLFNSKFYDHDILIENPKWVFLNKAHRQKDLDDYEFYKNYLNI